MKKTQGLAGAAAFVIAIAAPATLAQHDALPAPDEGVPTGAISGTVTDADGNPLPGVTVEALDTLRAAQTDRQGGFLLDDLPQGTYTLTASRFGLSTKVFEMETGSTQELVLGPNLYLAKRAATFTKPPEPRLAAKQEYLDQTGKATLSDTPNIVIINFDDLGYGDIGVYGSKLIATPHIDALATDSARLTEFYSASPVCTPSRAALLTGRYPGRALAANHVFFPSTSAVATLRKAIGNSNALPRDEILLGEILQQVNYSTAMVGKWHLGDEPGHRPNDLGFDRFFGVLYSNDMQPFALYDDEDIAIPDGEVDQRDLTDRYTVQAIRFIEENRERPFFLYFAHTFPHVPHFADEDHMGASQAGLYGDVVEDLDRSVGRVVDTLKAQGLYENTIIVVTSDNGGDYLGSVAGLRGRKGEIFEGGMRVPMIVRWPGQTQPGSEISGMAMNFDLYASVLAALGIEQPRDRIIDGRDIRAMIAGRSPSPHDYLFYTQAWSGDIDAVREDRFKYIDRIQKQSTQLFYPASSVLVTFAAPMLADLENDLEAHDVTQAHPETAERLEAELARFREQMEANPRGWFPQN